LADDLIESISCVTSLAIAWRPWGPMVSFAPSQHRVGDVRERGVGDRLPRLGLGDVSLVLAVERDVLPQHQGLAGRERVVRRRRELLARRDLALRA
jgi:hypothetical protein